MIKNLIVLFISVGFLACGSEGLKEKKLTVAAAASVQFAMKELSTNFSKKTGVMVDVITSSSGKLTTQVLNGAPYDLFFSANMKYPNAVAEKGKAVNPPIIYAYGVPVIWTMYPIMMDSVGNFLTDATVKKIAIAEKKNAPYGAMAVQFLTNNNIYKQIEGKLVYGESISQVNEYIISQSVEVGFTAKSIVCSPMLKGQGTYLELDRSYWIAQGIVMIKNETPNALKQQFIDYLISEEGTRILTKYGYVVR